MIVLPRSLCRDLHAVFRRLGRGRAAADTTLEMIAGRDGLTIQAATPDTAVRHITPGRWPEARLLVPLAAIAECAGPGESPATFRPTSGGIEASWSDSGKPTVRVFRIAGRPSPMPAPSVRFTPVRPEFLAALETAGTATARDAATRFVLNRIQLSGRRGEIVATDSKQLLIQTGFAFPWSDDVLVARSEIVPALGGLKAAPVAVARTTTHVWVRAGAWSIALAIHAGGKFPDVDALVARLASRGSELILDPADRERLLRELRPRTARTEDVQLVTLDLAGPLIRAEGRDGKAVSIPLSRSRVQGKRIRVSCERTYLLQALRLGLGRMTATTTDQPVVWRDASRTYLFLPFAGAASEETAPVRSRGMNRTKPMAAEHHAGTKWAPEHPIPEAARPTARGTPAKPKPVRTQPKRPRVTPKSKSVPERAHPVFGGIRSLLRRLFHR